MKLITACLLGLLAADVYALDCWGYMNKPKAIREAARVAAANAAKASAASSAPRTLRCVNGWCQ